MLIMVFDNGQSSWINGLLKHQEGSTHRGYIWVKPKFDSGPPMYGPMLDGKQLISY